MQLRRLEMIQKTTLEEEAEISAFVKKSGRYILH